MNIAQRLQDKGRQEGREEGRKEAREESRQEKVALFRALLKNGATFELIMKSTGLSREELLSLQ